jgi:riboflavin kinase / FMN adenylyltransferase
MHVHRNIDNLPVFRNAVVTIGTFDGVHAGHRQILKQMVEETKKINGESVIITFHPHPRKVVSSAILGVRLINTLEEKISLLEEAGIDHLVVVPFTDAFANLPAEDFVKNFLVVKFHPQLVIIGYDHRFGKERTGDYRMLERMAPIYGFRLKEIPRHILDEISISSTNIREAILHHQTETANRLLGYEFFFDGEVVHGNKLGRTLGYPTANLEVANPEKIIPGDGIYAVYVSLKDSSGKFIAASSHPAAFKGMMSIGFRPTVDGKKRVIEVNIFDFAGEIYGQTIRVFVKKFLRPELKFDSLETLTEQIGKDKLDSLEIL